MSNLFDLSGKRALITGSSRGLGLVLAHGLADAGAEIILNSRDKNALGSAAETLASKGVKVTALAFDVTSPDSIAEAIDYTEAQIGPIDILINNAGILHRAPLEEFPNDKFDQMLLTNVSSAFYVSRAVIPHMIERQAGKVINISSVSAVRGRPHNTPYAVTKAALTSMTQNMSAEWSRHGININAIAPGFIAGGMNTKNVKNEEYTKWALSHTPMGRWGEPEELIGAAVFLASRASSFVTGHMLLVDGGVATSIL